MVDVGLCVYLTIWYAGNYYYNIFNKQASKEAGGTTYVMTLCLIQVTIGSVYALFLWLAPEARARPKVCGWPQCVLITPYDLLWILSACDVHLLRFCR